MDQNGKKIIIVKCLFIIIIISTVDLRLRDTDHNMITSFINNIVINASLNIITITNINLLLCYK